MSKSTTLAKDWLMQFLPKSFKNISEVVSAEQLAEFSQEMTELKERLDAQQEGNTKLKEDFEAEKLKAQELQQKVTSLETEKTLLNTKLTEAEKDRNTYKEFYDQKSQNGQRLPKGDASNKETEAKFAADHPMSILLSRAQ
jgi:predicted nuclease with TOPRIM domain